MSSSQLRGLSASVHERLNARAREERVDANNLRLRYANERFLYRLGRSQYSESFVLKGAALFAIWTGIVHRPTRDMDLLGFGDPSEEALTDIFRQICAMGEADDIEDDGLIFPPETVIAHTVRDEKIYEGIKLQLQANLGHITIHMNVDVGFGDAITPSADETELPTILQFAAPRLRTYPRETVIAEKCENMLNRGIENSRLKDYFDIWYLAEHFDFDGQTLARAIAATCKRRQTSLPDHIPEALLEFCEDASKQAQWQAFLRRDRIASGITLPEVGKRLRIFLLPPFEAARDGQALNLNWKPKQGWLPEEK